MATIKSIIMYVVIALAYAFKFYFLTRKIRKITNYIHPVDRSNAKSYRENLFMIAVVLKDFPIHVIQIA